MNLSPSPDTACIQDDVSNEAINQTEEAEEIESPLSEMEKSIIDVVMFFNVSIEEASAR